MLKRCLFFISFLLITAAVYCADQAEKDRIIAEYKSYVNPKLSAIVLLDERNFTELENGKVKEDRHLLIKILHQSGIQTFGETIFSYNAFFEKFSIVSAQVISPDGKSVQVKEDAIRVEQPLSDFPGFLDTKTLKIIFPQVKVNSVLEVKIERQIDANLIGGFSEKIGLFSDWQTAYQRIRIDAFEKSPIKFLIKNADDALPSEEVKNGRKIISWEITKRYDKGMNSPARVAYWSYGAYSLISNVSSWESFSKVFRGLYDSVIYDEETIKAKAVELTKDCVSDEEKITKLVRFVSDEIRYVGIELGMASFRPDAPDLVLKNAYGDCKGKTKLLNSLLSAVGIQAYPVLVSVGGNDLVQEDFPADYFDHMISAVPLPQGGYRFIDATALFLSDQKIPFTIEGKKAVVLKPENYEFINLPSTTADDNLDQTDIEAVLTEGGSLSMNVAQKIIGYPAWLMRAGLSLSTSEELKKMITQSYKVNWPNAEVLDMVFKGEKDLNGQFEISFKVKIAKFGQKTGEMWLFSAPMNMQAIQQLFAEEKRFVGMDLGMKKKSLFNISVDVPQAYLIETLPKNIKPQKSNTIKADLQFSTNQQKILINGELSLFDSVISEGKYPIVKKTVELLVKALQEQIVLRKNKI